MKKPDLFTRGGFRYRNWIPAKVEPAVRIASPTWLAVERPFPRKSKIRVAALSSAGCGVCGNHRRGAGATPWDPWDCDATVSADYSVDWIDRWSSRRFPRWPGSGRGRKRRHWPPWKKPIPLHTIRPCSIHSSFIQLKIIYKILKINTWRWDRWRARRAFRSRKPEAVADLGWSAPTRTTWMKIWVRRRRSESCPWRVWSVSSRPNRRPPLCPVRRWRRRWRRRLWSNPLRSWRCWWRRTQSPYCPVLQLANEIQMKCCWLDKSSDKWKSWREKFARSKEPKRSRLDGSRSATIFFALKADEWAVRFPVDWFRFVGRGSAD